MEIEQIKALIRDVPDFPRARASSSRTSRRSSPTPIAFSTIIDLIVVHFGRGNVDKVVGIEARGFILAAPVAYHFSAGFVPSARRASSRRRRSAEEYALEYGTATLEIHKDAVESGRAGPDRGRRAGDRRDRAGRRLARSSGSAARSVASPA